MDKASIDIAKNTIKDFFQTVKEAATKGIDSSTKIASQCLNINEKDCEAARKVLINPDSSQEDKDRAERFLDKKGEERKQIQNEHNEHVKRIMTIVGSVSLCACGAIVHVRNPELSQKCFQATDRFLPKAAS